MPLTSQNIPIKFTSIGTCSPGRKINITAKPRVSARPALISVIHVEKLDFLL
jgi:hypothetical protein